MTYARSPVVYQAVGDTGSPWWVEVINDVFGTGIVGASQSDPSDAVDQSAGGGATTSAADFTAVGGVCKARNFPALNAVRVFQGQLNRVAHMKKWSKVVVDGAVGPATLALLRQVQGIANGSVMGDPSSCMTVAPDVDVLAAQIAAVADSLGAPAQVSGPLAVTVPTIVTKSGKTVAAPDAGAAGAFATLAGVEKLAILGVAGAVGYLVFRKRRNR